MHTATLYRYNKDGSEDRDTPIARISVDDDGCIDIRMMDGGLLLSMGLAQLGYQLMWESYPTAFAANASLRTG